MFDFREIFEDQARTKLGQFVQVNHSVRAFNILYWSLLTLISVAIFITSIAAHGGAIDLSLTYLLLTSSLSFLAFLLVSKSTGFLDRCNRFISQKRKKFLEFQSTRPLFLYFSTAILFVALPTILVAWFVAVDVISVNKPLNQIFGTNTSASNYLAAIAPTVCSILLGLLAAQVTLFTFVANFLLGKYSSRVASTLMRQPTIIILEVGTIAWLAIVLIILFWGIPVQWSSLPVSLFVGALLLPIGTNILLTFLLSIRGFTADEAIKIVSSSFCRKTIKSIPPTIALEKVSLLAKLLMMAGLDWRSPTRRNAFSLPTKAIADVIDALDCMTNAASQAVKDNHPEVLISALNGIVHIIKSYARARASYTLSTDNVFRHLVNTMHMLVNEVKSSPNQTLHAYVVDAIGNISKVAITVGNQGLGSAPKSNPILTHWVGLLEHSCLTFTTSDRSTAATAALNQIKSACLLCIKIKFDESVEYSIIPAIEKLFNVFVRVPNSWTNFLANRILSDVLMMWLSSIALSTDIEQKYRLNKAFGKTFFELLKIRIDNRPQGFDGSSFGSDLLKKTSPETVVIQDVFSALYLSVPKTGHEASAIAEMLENVLEGLGAATQDAIRSAVVQQGMFVQAFYECAYLVLRGLPRALQIAPRRRKSLEKPPLDENEYIASSVNQDGLIDKLLEVTGTLLEVMIRNDKYLFREEMHRIVWLLGFLLIRDGAELKFKPKIEDLFDTFAIFVETKLEDHRYSLHLPYLKLMGAWLYQFSPDSPHILRIREILAKVPQESGTSLFGSGSRSYEGRLGYPESHFGGKLFPPALRSIVVHSNQFLDFFITAGRELSALELLQNFHNAVEGTAHPTPTRPTTNE